MPAPAPAAATAGRGGFVPSPSCSLSRQGAGGEGADVRLRWSPPAAVDVEVMSPERLPDPSSDPQSPTICARRKRSPRRRHQEKRHPQSRSEPVTGSADRPDRADTAIPRNKARRAGIDSTPRCTAARLRDPRRLARLEAAHGVQCYPIKGEPEGIGSIERHAARYSESETKSALCLVGS